MPLPINEKLMDFKGLYILCEGVYDSNGTPLAIDQQNAVADLVGSMTGSVDGTIADVAAIALNTSDTYSDSAVNTAVNTAITSTNLQLKELQTKVNAILAALRGAGVIAT